MQVFKSYFKILNRHMGQMIMYLSIFIGVMVVLTATRTNKLRVIMRPSSPNLRYLTTTNHQKAKL